MSIHESLQIQSYIPSIDDSLVAQNSHLSPWDFISQAEAIISQTITTLPTEEYRIDNAQAIHRTANIESGAILKGPMIIGPNCFVGRGSLLRGGTFLEKDCIIGHGGELKTSFMFQGSKIAHLNFVGDSLLGKGVNVEAGAMIANYRNEKTDKEIVVCINGEIIRTGCIKFGAIVGDETRIGANAVLAPGTVLHKETIVPRLSLVDQIAD